VSGEVSMMFIYRRLQLGDAATGGGLPERRDGRRAAPGRAAGGAVDRRGEGLTPAAPSSICIADYSHLAANDLPASRERRTVAGLAFFQLDTGASTYCVNHLT
jgi:hypothetical protein